MYYAACFGDSLIQGFPFGPRYSWTAAAEEGTDLRLINYGVCGDCCDDIFYRLRTALLPAHIRHIIFLGGANDLLQQRPQKFILEDVAKMLQWCTEHGYHPCLVLPLISAEAELNRRLEALKQELKKQFAQQAFLLDLQPAIGLTDRERQKAYLDGVHPTASAYRAMGLYAAPLLRQWLSCSENK